MRTAVLVLVLLLSGEALAHEAHRGWLTGAGLMLSGVGAVAIAIGAYDAAQADAANRTMDAYYANGAAPTVREASAIRWLQERSESMGSLGLGLLISGSAAVLLGIAGVVLDGWAGQPSIAVSIRPTQASVLVSIRL